jgi:hypothetical protein
MAKIINIADAQVSYNSMAAVLMEFVSDIPFTESRLRELAHVNGNDFYVWKKTHKYIKMLNKHKPYRVKNILCNGVYTRKQIDHIWEVFEREKSLSYLLIVATFIEWARS